MTELEEIKAERDMMYKTICIIHKMLDNCNVPRESVEWREGGIQYVTEFPAPERLSILLQAWKDEREQTKVGWASESSMLDGM